MHTNIPIHSPTLQIFTALLGCRKYIALPTWICGIPMLMHILLIKKFAINPYCTGYIKESKEHFIVESKQVLPDNLYTKIEKTQIIHIYEVTTLKVNKQN